MMTMNLIISGTIAELYDGATLILRLSTKNDVLTTEVAGAVIDDVKINQVAQDNHLLPNIHIQKEI